MKIESGDVSSTWEGNEKTLIELFVYRAIGMGQAYDRMNLIQSVSRDSCSRITVALTNCSESQLMNNLT